MPPNEILSRGNIAFQVVREGTPGLANARTKGLSVAKYEYLLYCDDDNWLQEEYVEKIYRLLEQHREVVILGGMGEAVFEDAEPVWFKRFEHNFAVGDQSDSPNEFSIVHEVYGAGFTVRRSFLQELNELGFKNLMTGRTKNQLISGEDTELAFAANHLGYKIGYSRGLRFKHLMTAPRMKWSYMKKLYFGFGRTNIYSHAYQDADAGKDPSKLRLRFPFWLDTWIHKAKDTIRLYPKVMLKMNEEGDEDVLRFIAMKGELSELWSLKRRYNDLFQAIHQYINLFKRARANNPN